MATITNLKKGHGKIGMQRFCIIAKPNGYDFSGSNYIKNSTEYTFYLCHGQVNGNTILYFSADPDHGIASRTENMHGIAWFLKDGNNKVKLSTNQSISFSIDNQNLRDLFVGAPYDIVGSPSLFFIKDDKTKTDRNQRRINNMVVSGQEYLRPVSYFGTGTGPLTSVTDYIDLDDYVSSDNYESVSNNTTGKLQCYITDGNGNMESALAQFYDSETNRIHLIRGLGSTTATTFSGTHYIYIFNPVHLDNFDNINDISGLKTGISLYLVTEPNLSYVKSFYPIKHAYDPYNFSNQIDYYENDSWQQKYNYPDYMRSYLFSVGTTPDNITTRTTLGGKSIIKGENVYSDHYFTTPREANQGVIYRYCTENESCGNCMSNGICYVKANGYEALLVGDEPLTSQNENDDWNYDNKLWNRDIPTYISYITYGFVGALTICYIAWYGAFAAKLSTVVNIDSFYNWQYEEQQTILGAKIIGGLVAAVFVGVLATIIISAYGKSSNFTFPFVEYDRSKYNPPPGYVFEDSPTENSV